MANRNNEKDRLIPRAVDWVFGYDFFISYSHGDGKGLPNRLKERLKIFLAHRLGLGADGEVEIESNEA